MLLVKTLTFFTSAVFAMFTAGKKGYISFGPATSNINVLESVKLPESVMETCNSDPEALAFEYIQAYYNNGNNPELNRPPLEFEVSSKVTSKIGNGREIYHIYLKQLWNSLEIANAHANFNVLRVGNENCFKLISSYSSFFIPKNADSSCASSQPTSSPTIKEKDALKALFAYCKLKYDNKEEDDDEDALMEKIIKNDEKVEADSNSASGKIQLSYLQVESGDLELVWKITLKVPFANLYCDAMVSANSGKVIAFYDMVSQ